MWPRMLLLSALIIGSALAPPARAGGWWSSIQLRGHHLGVGEILTVRSEVSFWGEVSQETRVSDYHAYLVRGIDAQALKRAMSQSDPKDWWKPPAEMTLVGHVTLSRWESNLAQSTARLTIPEMPLGGYHLMMCDRGCRNPLGDIIPFRVEVVSDPLAAQTARRLQQTTERTSLTLAQVHKDLRRSIVRVNAAQADARQAVDMAVDAAADVRKGLASMNTETKSSPWPAYLGWFVGGFGVAIAALRGRRRAVSTFSKVPKGPENLVGSSLNVSTEREITRSPV